MADKKFPKGIVAFAPASQAPDYVLAQVVVNPKELLDWLKGEGAQYLKESKYGKQLKLTVKKSKDGKRYLEIDTYEKSSTANNSNDWGF